MKMGLFDEIVSVIGKQLGGGQQNSIIEQAMAMINNPETGGLSGLVEKFRQGGLGDVVSSWVGTGANAPVSGDQISNVLGADKIQDIAAKLGFSGSQVSDGLAGILPQIIDKLTPEGSVPEGNSLAQSISGLAEKFLKG
jgi:uncharacterized protein YidB (DUF937 family)